MKLETEKYKKEKETKTVLIPFLADRQLDYDRQAFYRGGYLFFQSEVYKNSHFIGRRNDKILYYDCTNYYFEIEQEDGRLRNVSGL